MDVSPQRKALLARVAETCGTPTYAYFLNDIAARVRSLRRHFDGRFKISYAAKSNPNPAILREMAGLVDFLDVSSGGEVELGLGAGWSPTLMSFTGPAKTDTELEEAVRAEVGHPVVESVAEARRLDRYAGEAGRTIPVLVRIAPQMVPKGFGARMSGRATQFGIPEEDMDEALTAILALSGLRVEGFHIYSGTQCLEADSIVENFRNMAEIFGRLCPRLPAPPTQLVFGSGLGVPYHPGQEGLNLSDVGPETVAIIDALRDKLDGADPAMVLETGRYLVGEAGYYLIGVIEVKASRGRRIAICDGGMNHHLAASGNLGSVIHRNYPFFTLAADGEPETVNVVGPLCTMIDTLGQNVELPPLDAGDIIGIGASGAYGLTTSPLHFISHRPPREVLIRGEDDEASLTDVSGLQAGPAAWTAGPAEASDG